ncbi:MFS transporter [Xanthobacter tagetidis]|uniref:MFS transporter n=1 Tax=Xanthobacter tagetidis TaxID=60216 RepID=A0A3L7AL37_9HYPH|nr:MFS transporter [Xanthobacter tagetidis]MBB6306834.1 MFS family permease [Xanthobacter tagetidis]RLP80092.1 MFS transporter [Xanthobacter tagetidis]
MAATRFRYVVVLLLFIITVVNYVDRAAISYAIPAMEAQLGLSKLDAGTILGAFGIGYAVTTLIGGFAVDRYGARLVLTIAAVMWSLSIGLTGVASGFLTLYLARTLLGVSEGPNFPAMTGALARWLPPVQQASAHGYALLAVPVALAIGGPIVTQLLALLDWRWTFGVLFALSVAWVPLWFFLFRDDPARSPHVNAAELATIRAGAAAAPPPAKRIWPERVVLRALLTNRTLLANYWAFFVFGYFLFFFMSWLPSYLHTVYKLELTTVGAFTVVPWLAAAVALWALGLLSDRLLKTTGRLRVARSYVIAGSQLVAALAVVPVAFADNLVVAIAGITVAVAASMGANAAYYAVNVDIVPERAATALGIMDFAFALAGFLAPALTGWVLHLRGSFTDGFLLMAALALSSVVVVLAFHHPDRDRRAH